MKRTFVFFLSAFIFSAAAFSQNNSRTLVSFTPILRYVDNTTEANAIKNNVNQGFVDTLNKYSRFRVTDGMTLDTTKNMIKKSGEAHYSETDIIEAGKATSSKYLCYSKVVKIQSQYNVYFNIIEIESGIPIATYETDCTYTELVNANTVELAVLKILEQDLKGTFSNTQKIGELKEKHAAQTSAITTAANTERDSKFRISFLPPAIISNNASELSWIQDIFPGRMVNAFFTYSTITPLDLGTEKQALDRIRASASSFYDEKTIKEAGKYANAPFYIFTSITENSKENYTAYFLLIDKTTGEAVASYRENCVLEQIRDRYESNVINKAVYNMLTEQLGTDFIKFQDLIDDGYLSKLKPARKNYAQPAIKTLKKELDQQQKGTSKIQQAKREAQELQKKIDEENARKKAEAQEKAAKAAAKANEQAKKAAEKAEKQKTAKSTWASKQTIFPTSGLDIGGGFANTNNIYCSSTTGIFNLAFNKSFFGLLTPYVSLGIKMNVYFPKADGCTFMNTLGMLNAQVVLAKHFAPYAFLGFGGSIFEREIKGRYSTSKEKSSGFAFLIGAGVYLPLTKVLKPHLEYSLAYNGKEIGWSNQFTAGLTINFLGFAK